LRIHKDTEAILTRAHRFRSLDAPGFLSLAKDLARLTADSLDAAAIQKRVPPPEGKKWGSLKSLEGFVAERIGPERAKEVLAPLFAIYDLRLGDAHLAGDLEHALPLLQIEPGAPYVTQGRAMLHACVSTLYQIASVLEELSARS
jgi:hypothetical protein